MKFTYAVSASKKKEYLRKYTNLFLQNIKNIYM